MKSEDGVLTPELKKEIDEMSQFEMARHWRFDQPGSRFFNGEVGEYFAEVFKKKGFFTPEISKALGWNK